MASKTAKLWLKDPATYPLLVVMAGGCGVLGLQLYRLAVHPDTSWIPSRRKTAGLRENFEYGENYHNHWIRKASKGKSMEIMPGINSMFVDTPREEARTH